MIERGAGSSSSPFLSIFLLFSTSSSPSSSYFHCCSSCRGASPPVNPPLLASDEPNTVPSHPTSSLQANTQLVDLQVCMCRARSDGYGLHRNGEKISLPDISSDRLEKSGRRWDNHASPSSTRFLYIYTLTAYVVTKTGVNVFRRQKMRCLISPSSALLSSSTTLRPPSMLPTTIWRVSRPAPSFLRLKLRRRPGKMVALGPRCPVVRAKMNHGREDGFSFEPNHFVGEIRTISWRSFELCTGEGYLTNDETLNKLAGVCGFAARAVIVVSHLMDSGSLTATALSSKIGVDTVQRTLGAFVDIFLDISEDCYNRKFDWDTVIRFLDALSGLASISNILLEDALEVLSHTHPRESLLENAFNSDVKKIHYDFRCQMDGLKDAILNPKSTDPDEVDPDELLTIYEGIEFTESFLCLMVARRQRALEKACGDSK